MWPQVLARRTERPEEGRELKSCICVLAKLTPIWGQFFFRIPGPGPELEKNSDSPFPAQPRKQENSIRDSSASVGLYKARREACFLKKGTSGKFFEKSRPLKICQSKICENVVCFRNIEEREDLREAQSDFHAFFQFSVLLLFHRPGAMISIMVSRVGAGVP